MPKPFKLAIVGTGQIAAHGHIPAVLASEHAELVALVDLNAERAAALVDRWMIRPRISRDVADVLDQVDGVIIATPNHTHRPLALQCLSRGVPVLIEKPLATCRSDAEEIVETAAAHDTVAAVGYCTRFEPRAQLLGSLLKEGLFGRVKRWVYQWGVRDWAVPQTGYSFNRSEAGGGVLMVNGSHFIDRIIQWFGYPEATEYYDNSRGGPESTARAKLVFGGPAGRMEGIVRLSKEFRLKSGFVMEAEGGTLVMPEESRGPMIYRPVNAPQVTMAVESSLPGVNEEKSLFHLQLEDFIAAVRERRPPMVSARTGLESLRLILQLYQQRRSLREAGF